MKHDINAVDPIPGFGDDWDGMDGSRLYYDEPSDEWIDLPKSNRQREEDQVKEEKWYPVPGSPGIETNGKQFRTNLPLPEEKPDPDVVVFDLMAEFQERIKQGWVEVAERIERDMPGDQSARSYG